MSAMSNSWIVIHDPLDVGGFPKGTRFTSAEVCGMLRFNCLLPGTRLYRRIYGEMTVTEGYRLMNDNYWAYASTQNSRPKLVIAKIGG